MSRNFELMTQIESEADEKDHRTQAPSDQPVERPAGAKDAGDAGGDEILRLVQNIFFSSNARVPRQVVFCGVDGENGSSSVCVSAGRTLAANTSRSVCLVDANLRSPRLPAFFGADSAGIFPGRPSSVRERCIRVGDNLWLAGQDFLADDSCALPSVTRLKQLLAELSGVFEFVLIDAPGSGISGDAAILGQAADATILVIEANHTRRLAARKAKESLDASGVRLLGTVLHNRSFPIPRGLYQRL